MSKGEEPSPVPTAGTGSVSIFTVTKWLGSVSIVNLVNSGDELVVSQETPKTPLLEDGWYLSAFIKTPLSEISSLLIAKNP